MSLDFLNDPDHQRGLRCLRAAAGREADNLSASTALLLLTPPALTVGRIPTARRWLRANGFEVSYAQPVHLGPGNIRRIWKYQPHGHDPLRARIVGRLMTSGACLLVAAVYRSAGGRSAAARLKDLKGPSDPRRCSSHHLRAHLGAANMFNNLVHASDGSDEVVREAAAILDDDELVLMWRKVCQTRGRSTQSAATSWAESNGTVLGKGVSLSHIAAARRAQAVAAIRAELPDPALTDDIVDQLLAERSWLATRNPMRPVSALRDFRSAFAPVERRLRSVCDGALESDNARLRQLMTFFVETDAALFGTAFDSDRLEETADRACLPLDTLDRIVFSTEWLARRYEVDPAFTRPQAHPE